MLHVFDPSGNGFWKSWDWNSREDFLATYDLGASGILFPRPLSPRYRATRPLHRQKSSLPRTPLASWCVIPGQLRFMILLSWTSLLPFLVLESLQSLFLLHSVYFVPSSDILFFLTLLLELFLLLPLFVITVIRVDG